MPRPRCSVFIATSLDGYIARRDGSIDWLDAVQRPGEDYGFRDFFDGVDTLIMGRGTYETALGFPAWPYLGKRCVVLTHAPRQARHGEEFRAGEPAALVQRLGTEGTRRAYVDGGQVVSAFLAARLIHDVTLSIVPVVFGDGIRLFAPGGIEQPLVLASHRAYESGLVQLRYEIANVST